MISSSRAALALLLALVTLTLAEDKKGLCDSNNVPRKRMVCVYRTKTSVSIPALDPCLCNHILYDAVSVNDKNELINENKSDFEALKDLKKKNPSLQTIVTVRGLDSPTYDNATNSIEYETAVKVFAENVRSYLERYQLNGINLGWKYREFNDTDDVTEFRERLTTLVERLNATLRNGSRDGTNYPVISITVTNRAHLLDSGYDFKNLSRFINFVNLPAFRFDHHPNTTIQHPSRLYGIDDIENMDSIVDLLLSEGVSKEKLNVGVPTFAMSYVLKDVNMSTPGSPAGSIGNQTKPPSWILTHPQWCSLRNKGNWTIERERDQTAPYAHYGLLWVGFDDETSLKLKSRYVLLRNLGGITVWSINDDDTKGSCGSGKFPLLKAIQDVLSGTSNKKDSDNIIAAASQEKEAIKVIKRNGLVKRAGEIGSHNTFICSRRGYFRHPEDCSLFYRCVKLRTMRERSVVLVYTCPRGLVYDERYEICNWPSWSPPCDGSGEVFPVPKKRFVCPGVGYYQDPENCRWFYYCSVLGAGNSRAYEFRCPFALLGFDEEKQACNWRWRVPGCSPMDSNQHRTYRTNHRQGRLPSSSSAHTTQPAQSPPLTSLGPIGPLGAIGSLLRGTSSSGLPTRRPYGLFGRMFPQRPTLLSMTTFDSENRPRMTYNFNHRASEEPKSTPSGENITPPIEKAQTSQVEKVNAEKEEDDFSDDDIDDTSETRPDKDIYYDDKPSSTSTTAKDAQEIQFRPQPSNAKKPIAEGTLGTEYSNEQEPDVSSINRPTSQEYYSNGHGYHEQYTRGREVQQQYLNEQGFRPDYPRQTTRPNDYGKTLGEQYVDTFRQPTSPSGPGLMVTVQRRPRPPVSPHFYYEDSPYNTLSSRSGPRDFRIKFELLPSSKEYGPESYAFGRRKGQTPPSQLTSSTTPLAPFIRIDFPPLIHLGPSRREFIGDTTDTIDSKSSDSEYPENKSSYSKSKKEPIQYSRAYSVVDEKGSTPLAAATQRNKPSQSYIYVTPNGFTNVRPSRFYPFVEVPLSSVAPNQVGNLSHHHSIRKEEHSKDDATWEILPTLKALMETLSRYATTKASESPAVERRADRFGFGARIRGGGARGSSRATTVKPTTESDQDEDYDDETTTSAEGTTQTSTTAVPTTTIATTTTTTSRPTKAARGRDRSRYSDFGDFPVVEGHTYRSRGSSRRRGGRRGKSRTTSTQTPTTTEMPTTSSSTVTEAITTTTTELITKSPKRQHRGRGRGRGRGSNRRNSKERQHQKIEEAPSTEIPSSTQPQTTTVSTTLTDAATTTATITTVHDVTTVIDGTFTEIPVKESTYGYIADGNVSKVYDDTNIIKNISLYAVLFNETENVVDDLRTIIFNDSRADRDNESTVENVERNTSNFSNLVFTEVEKLNLSISNLTESLNGTHVSDATVAPDTATNYTTLVMTTTEGFGLTHNASDTALNVTSISETLINTTPINNQELESNTNFTDVNKTTHKETIKVETENAQQADNSTNPPTASSTRKPRRGWDDDFSTPRPEFARRTRTRTTRQPSRRRQQFTRERRPTPPATTTTTTTSANLQHYTKKTNYIPQEVTTQSTIEEYSDYDEVEEENEEDQGSTYAVPVQTPSQNRQFRGPQGGIYSRYPSDDYGEQSQTPSVRSRPQAPQSYTDDDLEELPDDDYVEDDYLTDEKRSQVRATISNAPQSPLYQSSTTQDARHQYSGVGQAQYSIPPPRSGRAQLSYGITTPRPQFSYEEILTREYSPPDPPQQFKKRIQQSTPTGSYYTVQQYQPATSTNSRFYYPSPQFSRRTDDAYVDHSRTFSRRMDEDDESVSVAKTSPSYGKVKRLTTPSLPLQETPGGFTTKKRKFGYKERAENIDVRDGISKLDSNSELPLKVTTYPIREGEKPKSITPPENIPPEGRTNLPFAPSGDKTNETNNDVIPQIACTRPGLFYHPDDCNKFYECYWDNWIKKFTLHIFECPVKLVFDDRLFGCNSIALGPCEKHKDRETIPT